MNDDLSTHPSAPDVGRSDEGTASWRALLYERFANQPTPVVLFSDSVRSAASLWTGTRAWTSTFRAVGVARGDRVVSALPAGDALLQLTFACLWESVGLVLASTGVNGQLTAVDVDLLLERHDARCLVGAMVPDRPVLEPAAGGWPVSVSDGFRARATTGQARNTAAGFEEDIGAEPMPYAECLAAAHHRRAHGAFARARVLTLCDWQRRAGLWGGVILPLLEVEELFVPRDRTNAAAVHRLLVEEPITHALVEAGTSAKVRSVLLEQGVPVVVLPDTDP